MLNLSKIAGALPDISQHFQAEAQASRQRLDQSLALWHQTQLRQAELIALAQQFSDRLFFSVALPVEPLVNRPVISAPPVSHSIFATDGSQIAPSHHEIAYCYLINIGRIMLHYGQNRHPLIDSVPEVYYRPEDLYVSRQWGIRTEDWMAYRRTVLEAQFLAEMAGRWVNPPGPHGEPNLALVDGSLIYWFLEGLPLEARDQILTPILTAWDLLRDVGVPLMGYLSASRSTEALNLLRLQACPHNQPHCAQYCYHQQEQEEKTPCQVFDPLRDSQFWQQLLMPGQRSPLWQSSLRILDLYPAQQRIYFCYVNVGTEIARVEFPAWVAEDQGLLDRSLAILLAQINKGFGYPVALAEAHNQAVVRSGDRARFFALLEQQMIKAGLHNVGISYKEARKRGSIV